VAASLAAGFVLHHHLPARACGNCAAVVCRRCATRRRDQALCHPCAALVTTATTPEFGRLLLLKRRREIRRRQGRARTALAILVPGYGAFAFDRMLVAWAFFVGVVLTMLTGPWAAEPFPYVPRM